MVSINSNNSSQSGVDLIDEITLGGKQLQVRAINIPLENVQLDPTNPRIAHTVNSMQTNEAEIQNELAEFLWKEQNVQQLYRSVLDNKGLIDRIIVRSNFVVAEGNCRTVVYQKLKNAYPDDPTWRTIPTRILPDDVSDRQIAILLGELHVGGKNQWSAFEKAGHIYSLYNMHGLHQDEIAKLLRTSKSSVNQHIHAFEVMKNNYLPAYPESGSIRKFSYFLELFKKPNLKKWVKDSPEAIDEFVQLVGEEKIGTGATVREIADIVINKDAMQVFKEKGLEEAKKVLGKLNPEKTTTLFKLMHDTTQAIENARMEDIQNIRKDDTGSAKAIVRKLEQSLKNFLDLCGDD